MLPSAQDRSKPLSSMISIVRLIAIGMLLVNLTANLPTFSQPFVQSVFFSFQEPEWWCTQPTPPSTQRVAAATFNVWLCYNVYRLAFTAALGRVKMRVLIQKYFSLPSIIHHSLPLLWPISIYPRFGKLPQWNTDHHLKVILAHSPAQPTVHVNTIEQQILWEPAKMKETGNSLGNEAFKIMIR